MVTKRSNAAEHRRRITQIRRMLAARYHSADICRYASDKWHVCRRQGERYIAEATKELASAKANNPDKEAMLSRENYAFYIREQVAAHDWNGAGLNESRLCKLLGANAAEKHELTGPNGVPINNNDEAKAALFRAMIEAQAKRLKGDRRPPSSS